MNPRKNVAFLRACAAGWVLLAAGVPRAEEAPVAIRLRWPPGKVFTRVITIDQSVEVTPESGAAPYFQNARQSTEISLACLPGESEGESARLLIRVQAVDASTTGPGVVWRFDSRTDTPSAENPLANLAGATNTLVTVVLGLDGRPTSVSGPEAGRGNGADFLGGDFFRRMLEESLAGLPPSPVRTGDTWHFTQRRELPGFGTLSAEQTGTFTGRRKTASGEVLALAYTGRLTSKGVANLPDGTGAMMRFTGTEGTLVQELRLDETLGQTVMSKLEQELRFTVETRRGTTLEKARGKVVLRCSDKMTGVRNWTSPPPSR